MAFVLRSKVCLSSLYCESFKLFFINLSFTQLKFVRFLVYRCFEFNYDIYECDVIAYSTSSLLLLKCILLEFCR